MWLGLLDDPEIFLDHRRMNSKPSSTIFDEFWDELWSCLHETRLAVDERRPAGVMHVPFTILIHHLLDLITERLKSKHPDSTVDIPMQEWVRLQLGQPMPTLNERFVTLDNSKSRLDFRNGDYSRIILILVM